VTGSWSDPQVDKAGQTEVLQPNFEIKANEDTKEETKEETKE
jgi:hypothetical protein